MARQLEFMHHVNQFETPTAIVIEVTMDFTFCMRTALESQAPQIKEPPTDE
jgi:hypothetical protein